MTSLAITSSIDHIETFSKFSASRLSAAFGINYHFLSAVTVNYKLSFGLSADTVRRPNKPAYVKDEIFNCLIIY